MDCYNKKKPKRKGKVQLIDGSSFYKSMKKSLGSKRKFIDDSQREQLFKLIRTLKRTNTQRFLIMNSLDIQRLLLNNQRLRMEK